MVSAKNVFPLLMLLIGIGGWTSTIKWVPSLDMSDNYVGIGKMLGGWYNFWFSFSKAEDVKIEDGVNFYYYSRQNQEKPIALKPGQNNSLVKQNILKPFKLIIHGFLHSSHNEMTVELRRQLLKFHDFNVINVDWSNVSRLPFYFMVAQKTRNIGLYLAQLLNYLIDEGANPKDIHLIGHSLGSHVAGYAGANTKKTNIGRITGLDPALPGFMNSDVNKRLDPSDAEFVDCIHTCGGTLGFMNPICHADFYPNGGRNFQPGCMITDLAGKCSHLRAPTYFQESIDPQYRFSVAKCPQIPSKEPIECTWSGYNMGYYLDPRYGFQPLNNYNVDESIGADCIASSNDDSCFSSKEKQEEHLIDCSSCMLKFHSSSSRFDPDNGRWTQLAGVITPFARVY